MVTEEGFRRSEEGYNLVVVMVALTVMSILVAAALPAWSHQIRRAREEEAIFRGLQYAEAIRVFQKRFNRFPTRLEELLEVEPRSIRQLWTDPLSEHGQFGVLVSAAQPGAGNREAQSLFGEGSESAARQGAASPFEASPAGAQAGGFDATPADRGATTGGAGGGALIRQPRVDERGEPIEVAGRPIHGVYVDLEGEATRLFLGESDYAKWDFVVEMIPTPQAVGDRPVKNARSDWVGKPFPQGLQPVATGPGADGALPGFDADEEADPELLFGRPRDRGRGPERRGGRVRER